MPPKKTPSAPAAAPSAPSEQPKQKKAPSGYMKYAQSERASVASSPAITSLPKNKQFGAIGKELGSRWAGLSADEKKKYA